MASGASISTGLGLEKEKRLSDQRPETRDDLLAPVLGTAQLPVPAYSTGAQFLTAFFGGPFAIILFAGLNAYHMGRSHKDGWRFVLAMIVSITLVAWIVLVFQGISPPAWIVDLFGDDTGRAVTWIVRGFGLFVWLALWLPNRRFHRAAEIMGIEPRRPWIPALICISTAIVMQLLLEWILNVS